MKQTDINVSYPNNPCLQILLIRDKFYSVDIGNHKVRIRLPNLVQRGLLLIEAGGVLVKGAD